MRERSNDLPVKYDGIDGSMLNTECGCFGASGPLELDAMALFFTDTLELL